MNIGTTGTGTAFDLLLNEYFPQRADDALFQAFENETDALLAALLIETQKANGDDPEFPQEQRPQNQEASYFTTEQPLPVDSVSEERLDFDFPATSVTIWGFDAPVYVSFKSTGDQRKIPLTPSESPFNLAPEGGLGASSIWIRKPDESSADTQIKVLALQ
ncbi:hypothetical protein JZX76_11475 [Haloarcula hispanica]|uniref:Uncharacterized protein n=1 Tax=Haloarcula hispanica TaxID=51589 RepID=A0A482TBY5_HALHI|nr:hypothetical protein [Haloarcula hispanica]MCJ0620107.1 hypothetical protein [Haloarcula hispanica]RYJ10537.1 hypothetical protein ELS20_11400 [Haloarcula hispanica]